MAYPEKTIRIKPKKPLNSEVYNIMNIPEDELVKKHHSEPNSVAFSVLHKIIEEINNNKISLNEAAYLLRKSFHYIPKTIPTDYPAIGFKLSKNNEFKVILFGKVYPGGGNKLKNFSETNSKREVIHVIQSLIRENKRIWGSKEWI